MKFLALLPFLFLLSCGDKPTNPEGILNINRNQSLRLVEVAAEEGDYKTFLGTLKAADMVNPLLEEGPFTLFAPTDAAFAELGDATFVKNISKPYNKDLLTSILKYHVVDGIVDFAAAGSMAATNSTTETQSTQVINLSMKDGSLMINESKVTKADIVATNGVIHQLDKVLLPPGLDMSIMEKLKQKDILDKAKDEKVFKTLLDVIKQVKLTSVLEGEGPFTFFAPTDAAFEKLGPDFLKNLLKKNDKKELLKENKEKLTQILLYHVIPAKVMADEATVLAGQTGSANTVNTAELSLTIQDVNGTDTLFVNDAQVTKTDIDGLNGVVHVIDTVLLPPGM